MVQLSFLYRAADFTPSTRLTLNGVSTALRVPFLLFHSGPRQLETQNKERMHLQRRSIITTRSQQVSSRLCPRKTISTGQSQDYRFPFSARKRHKNDTYSDTNMKKNAVRHAHARCENWHPRSGRLFALHCYQRVYAVWCVCVRLHACVNST